jgi:hypothetical protein
MSVPTFTGRPRAPYARETVARSGVATGDQVSRGLGSAGQARAGLAAMPSVQQHLQRNGQSMQSWGASRDQGINRLHQQNAPRIAAFQQNREATWSRLQGFSTGDRVRMAREKGVGEQSYRGSLDGFRNDRGNEIRDRVGDGADNLFTSDWWGRNRGFNVGFGDYSPWWWWNSSPWSGLDGFGYMGGESPIYYDYGANVIEDGDVYVDGQDDGPVADYTQQAVELANPPEAVDEPAPPQDAGQPAEWQPLGVFGLVQEEKGDAVMFFQLAINRDGLIGGAFANMLTDGSAIVTGSVDKKTQRAAWRVAKNSRTIYEAGVANLTQEVAPVLIHFDSGVTQTWLLVHMASPEMPTAPTAVNAQPQK